MELAIVPYLPARILLERYKPLRVYLERSLRRPVTLFTAPDYQTFIARTQRREYTFVVTVAHAARLAELEAGYVPMLRPAMDTHAILLVARDGPIRSIADLRGRRVAVPDNLAIVTQLGAEVLRSHGLKPGEDVTLYTATTHSTAMHAVLAGEAEAAVVSDRAFIAAASDLKQELRAIATSASGVPGVVYLASPAVPGALVAEITQAILGFANETADGRKFLESLGYDALRALKPDELAVVDGHVAPLKAELRRKQP
jgi:phosphonate transport system substrate-binding protein